MANRSFLGLVAAALAVVGCSSGTPETAASATTGGTPGASAGPAAGKVGAPNTGTLVAWNQVQPIFNKNCVLCHGGPKGKAGINFTDYAMVTKKGSVDGPIVIPGDPANSVIVKAIKGEAGVTKMPPKGQLSKADIDLIAAWIKSGAKGT